jgi:hypothetical protein
VSPYLRALPSGRLELVCPVDAPPWRRWWAKGGQSIHDELVGLGAPVEAHRDYCEDCDLAPDRRLG